jgi:acylphosphatase
MAGIIVFASLFLLVVLCCVFIILEILMPTIRLIIKGRVQGVFYRATAKDVAEQNGISGWVKNTAEGYVEIMATGSEEQLENFLQWCRQGPPRAQVMAIEQEKLPEQAFDGFRITRY